VVALATINTVSPARRGKKQSSAIVTCPGYPGYCSESYVGDTCLVVCARGRSNVPVCQDDGTWTDEPRCIEHEPGKQEQVPGVCPGVPGYCSLDLPGGLCTFECPIGPAIRSSCTPDGTWEPYPFCQGDPRETQDGCDPCPGPNGGPRNRTAEAGGGHHVEAIMQALELAIEIVEAIIGRLQQAAIIEKLEEVAIGKTIEEVAIGKIMEEVHQEEMGATETRMEGRETMAMVVLSPSKTTVHHQSSNHEATQASVLTRTAMVEAAEVRVAEEEGDVLEKFLKPALMCVLDFPPECFLHVLQVVPEDVLVGNRIPGTVMSRSHANPGKK